MTNWVIVVACTFETSVLILPLKRMDIWRVITSGNIFVFFVKQLLDLFGPASCCLLSSSSIGLSSNWFASLGFRLEKNQFLRSSFFKSASDISPQYYVRRFDVSFSSCHRIKSRWTAPTDPWTVGLFFLGLFFWTILWYIFRIVLRQGRETDCIIS